MAISITGTLTPAGSFPVANVADIAGAASQDFATTAAETAAADAVGAIPAASATVAGLATPTQVAKLEALPADAQSAAQVAAIASAAVVAGRTTVNGTPVTALTLGPGLTSSVEDGVATISGVNPQQDTVGASILTGALVWGSSLSATLTTVGGAISDATIAAITPTGLTIATGGTGPLPAQTAVIVTEDTSTGPHHFGLTPAGVATGGKRTRLKLFWKPFGATAGRAFLHWVNGITAQAEHRYDTDLNAGAGDCTSFYHWDTWKRADGWYQTVIEFANNTNQLYFKPNGGHYAGSTANGFYLAGLDVRQEYVSALTNLATGSSATITSSAGPDLDSGDTPWGGWIDRTPALLWRERDGATLSVSTIHSNLSGTDTPMSFSFLWEPYAEVETDSVLFEAAGTTARLRLELTTESYLKLTRITDAGVTTTVTFSRYVGLTAQACTVVVTGSRARMYLQDRLVDDKAFASGTASTFTSTTIGSGTLRARVAEFAFFGSALASWQAVAVNQSLSARRGWSIAPMPLYFHIGQSNCLPNGVVSQLPSFNLPADGRSIHYETGYAYDVGWGRVRGCGSATVRKWRMNHAGHKLYEVMRGGNFGSELMFSAALGRVATVRFAVGGTAIAQFLPGGTQHAAMLAGFDDAVAKIGIPYQIKGFLIDWGEDDSYNTTLANAFPGNVDALTGFLASRYGANEYRIFVTKLHGSLTTVSFPARDALRAAEEAQAAATPTRWFLTSIDDQALGADAVHRLSPLTQQAAGQRFGVAAQLAEQTRRY